MSTNNNNQIDLEISSLLNFSIQDLTEEIVPQSVLIESDKKNKNNLSFYNSINELYQRIRTLELVNQYIKDHVISEVSNKTHQIKKTIQEIESLKEKNKKLTIEKNLSLVSDLDSFRDKNGEVLPPSSLYDNNIVLCYQSVFDAKINNIILERRTSTPYKSSPITNILKEEVYRTMYVLKDYQEDGVIESIVLKLSTPSVINNIDIGLHNCYIDSIILTDINHNSKKYTRNDLMNISKNKHFIQEVEINIVSKNFKQVKYNKSKLNKNFYNSVNMINKNYEDRENNVYSKDSLYLHENSKETIREREVIDPELSLQYIMGIDYINIKFVQTSSKSCYISKQLNLSDKTYAIEIQKDHNLGDGTIEYFYIINNEQQYIPNEKNQNIREVYFFNTNNEPSENKIMINGKNGTLEQLKNGDIISYKTKDTSFIKIKKDDIVRVGAILREGEAINPTIKNIKVIEHIGGDINE